MKLTVLAGVAAAAFWAGTARAQDASGTQSSTTTNSTTTTTTTGQSDALTLAPPEQGQAQASQPDTQSWLRGVTVLVGGGVEGFTGGLAPRVKFGPAWNLIVGFHPTSVFGIELAYTGAAYDVNYGNFGATSSGGGPDILRNGGHADVTFGIGPWVVQPFVLAGVGITHYDVRTASARAAGFSSGTAGYIPLGGGIRGQAGAFTIDLRGTWSLPFSDDLYPGGSAQNTLGLRTGNYGRWNATANIGATF